MSRDVLHCVGSHMWYIPFMMKTIRSRSVMYSRIMAWLQVLLVTFAHVQQFILDRNMVCFYCLPVLMVATHGAKIADADIESGLISHAFEKKP